MYENEALKFISQLRGNKTDRFFKNEWMNVWLPEMCLYNILVQYVTCFVLFIKLLHVMSGPWNNEVCLMVNFTPFITNRMCRNLFLMCHYVLYATATLASRHPTIWLTCNFESVKPSAATKPYLTVFYLAQKLTWDFRDQYNIHVYVHNNCLALNKPMTVESEELLRRSLFSVQPRTRIAIWHETEVLHHLQGASFRDRVTHAWREHRRIFVSRSLPLKWAKKKSHPVAKFIRVWLRVNFNFAQFWPEDSALPTVHCGRW